MCYGEAVTHPEGEGEGEGDGGESESCSRGRKHRVGVGIDISTRETFLPLAGLRRFKVLFFSYSLFVSPVFFSLSLLLQQSQSISVAGEQMRPKL